MYRVDDRNRRMTRGFSTIETVIVVMIASLMVQLAVSVSGPVLDRMAVKSASGSLVALHARARAHAIERGRVVRLRIDLAGDSAWISDGDERIETLRLGQERNVELTGTGSVVLCLNTRGYADTNCNSFSDSVAFGFSRGTASENVVILSLGQMVRQ